MIQRVWKIILKGRDIGYAWYFKRMWQRRRIVEGWNRQDKERHECDECERHDCTNLHGYDRKCSGMLGDLYMFCVMCLKIWFVMFVKRTIIFSNYQRASMKILEIEMVIWLNTKYVIILINRSCSVIYYLSLHEIWVQIMWSLNFLEFELSC